MQFDPPNDHKDYLHRSGRTARAGATGMVVALVEHGQVRELQRLHDAAGVTAASDEVATGHYVVREIAATSGTRGEEKARPGSPAQLKPWSQLQPRSRAGAAVRQPSHRDGFARDTAQPARRANRPRNAKRAA